MVRQTNYSIIGTETRLIKSTLVDQEFQISIALPVFYSREPDKKCPVIYLLDSNFYFGMVTEMTRIMAQCFEFPDTVIVGIGYPWIEPAADAYDLVSGCRLRDYSPVTSKFYEAEILKWSPALKHCESGGAPDFLQFITKELIPLIESEYPIDSTNRTIVGHSLGGTFALYALFHTDVFHKYVVCDADYHFGDKILFEHEKEYAEKHDNLPVKLFLSNTYAEDILHHNIAEFLSPLKSREYKDLIITQKEMQGFRHCEAVAPFIQAGLKEVFS